MTVMLYTYGVYPEIKQAQAKQVVETHDVYFTAHLVRITRVATLVMAGSGCQ